MNSTQRRKKRRAIRASLQAVYQFDAAGEVSITAVEGDDKAVPRFSMIANTGQPMRPGGWQEDHPVILDLSGMEPTSGIPIHRDHDSGKIAGHSDKVITGNQLVIEGALSGSNIHASEIRNSSLAGFRWQASVGATLIGRPKFIKAGDSVTVNGRSFKGPVSVARRWQLREASFVSMGADSSTSAVAASERNNMNPFQKWLEASGWKEDELSDSQLVKLKAAFEAETATATTNTTAAATAVEPVTVEGDSVVEAAGGDGGGLMDITAQMRTEAAGELRRQMTASEHLSDFPELRAKAVEEGWAPEKCELEAYKARDLAVEAMRDQRPTGPGIHSKDSQELVNSDVFACKMHRSSMVEHVPATDDQLTAMYGEKTMEQSDRLPVYAGLHYLCFEVIRAAGGHVPAGVSMTTDLWNKAVEANQHLQRNVAFNMNVTAASGFSTFSIPNVLNNLQNKTLLQIYNEWPSLVGRICSTETHKDFKGQQIHRIDGDLELERLAPTGEIAHGSLLEEFYTSQLFVFAKMLAIDMQTFINDDLNAFSRRGALMGNAAMRTREKALFAKLLNPALVGTFFDATAGANKQNHLTGTNLDAPGLEAAKLRIRQMKSAKGNPIMVQPDFILTSTFLEETANVLLNLSTVRRTNSNEAAGTPTLEFAVEEQFKGRFGHASSPWMDQGNSIPGALDTTWFMFGNKIDGGAFTYATLAGMASPMLKAADTDFNTWGFQNRLIWPWGFNERMEQAIVRVDA